ncbi:hypothetical protein [Butyrivibrio sp. LC3010]|uniref:hypothetical protein n=1 Tax=Butyrivibrio sp. LC3010 TaxID=1280680 RepID=UPI00041514E3|nr:hypothetical protein [Butyrivibrio sp. LC3010]
MKKSTRKTIIAILLVNCILVAVAVCGKILSRFDYKDHFDDIVITVNDKGITLREFGYYIYEVEAFVQKQALLYDPENPKHWWNTHFSAGLDSQFVCDYAKKVVINTCIMDEIYYEGAISKEITLSSLEENEIRDEAEEMLDSMSPDQLEATGLNLSLIIKIKQKHALASKFAQYIVENGDFSGYSMMPEKLVNWDGEYYLEEILPGQNVVTNDRILDKIALGKITVNND